MALWGGIRKLISKGLRRLKPNTQVNISKSTSPKLTVLQRIGRWITRVGGALEKLGEKNIIRDAERDIERWLSAKAAQPGLLKLQMNEMIPYHLMSPERFVTNRKYRDVALVTIRNPATNAVEKKYWSMYRNIEMSKEQILQNMRMKFATTDSYKKMDIEDMELQTVWFNPAFRD